MRLFDETRPPSPSLSQRTESVMEFLNRVTLPPFERAREDLEALFHEYSLQHEQKRQLKKKLWGDEASSEGAFYEMFMAGAFRRLSPDCVVQEEYGLNGKPVDLRVSHPSGDFYVECKTRLPSEHYPHLQQLLDALDKDRDLAESPFIGAVFVRKLGGTTPSKSRFLRAVKTRLPELRTLEASVRDAKSLPNGEVCEPILYQPNENVKVEVKFYWHGDKRSRRFVAINSLGGGVVPDETPSILGALEDKAYQHRTPDMPYVIAINWLHHSGVKIPGRWRGANPEEGSVYGEGHFDMKDESKPYAVKAQVNRGRVDCWLEPIFREGLFVDSQGKPQHRRVSGVLFTRRTTPLLDNLSWKFFGNPFATRPAPKLFRDIPNVWPHLCEYTRDHEGSTTWNVPEYLLPQFPEGFRAGLNQLSASETFKYQGFLRSDVVNKVELHDLLGIDYPEPEELRRLEEEALGAQVPQPASHP